MKNVSLQSNGAAVLLFGKTRESNFRREKVDFDARSILGIVEILEHQLRLLTRNPQVKVTGGDNARGRVF